MDFPLTKLVCELLDCEVRMDLIDIPPYTKDEETGDEYPTGQQTVYFLGIHQDLSAGMWGSTLTEAFPSTSALEAYLSEGDKWIEILRENLKEEFFEDWVQEAISLERERIAEDKADNEAADAALKEEGRVSLEEVRRRLNLNGIGDAGD